VCSFCNRADERRVIFARDARLCEVCAVKFSEGFAYLNREYGKVGEDPEAPVRIYGWARWDEPS
jgi:hypothetical protein